MQMSRSKWFQPAFAVGLMVGFGALILLGGRSETVRGLRGDGRDERFKHIDLAATAFAGIVLITVSSARFSSRSLVDRTAARTPP